MTSASFFSQMCHRFSVSSSSSCCTCETVADDKVFLYIIRVDYPSIWEMVLKDSVANQMGRLIIVVPQGISLSSEVTLDDVQTHILHESNNVPGEFYALNSKQVYIDGSDLCTKQGFVENRRVRIMGSEIINGEMSDADDQTAVSREIKILHVSRPLEGGVNAPDDETDGLAYDSLCKYVAILRSSAEVEGIFLDMDSFIAEINFLGDYSTDGFQRLRPSLEACVANQWRRSVTALHESTTFEGSLGVSAKERHRYHTAQLVESYLMGGMHRTVYPWMQQQLAGTDQKLSQLLQEMRSLTYEDIGVVPEFHLPSVSEAVDILAQLGHCRTPSEKLLTLKATCVALFQIVQKHLRAQHQGETLDRFQLATDDLVQLIIYTTIQAYPHSACLLLDLRYIKQFHFVSTSKSSLGYYLNNFEVALDYILSWKGKNAKG